MTFNAVRMYEMRHPDMVDYSDFIIGAAQLGIYIIVPLTTAAPDMGDLDRQQLAPRCYPQKLYEYGIKSIREYSKYPNVLAGMVGNEVMDRPKTWSAGPCVRAYSRDLKQYMDRVTKMIHARDGCLLFFVLI